ncbi:unnamed protein product, partial [marine sediment metagenome]
KIICGDCLEVMRKIPNKSIDLVIADPPFNLGLDYGNFNDQKEIFEYWNWLDDRIQQIHRVLKNDTRFYIFHSDNGIFELKATCEFNRHFKFHQILVWHRPNLINPRRISRDWHQLHELILLFQKGKRTKMISSATGANCYSVQIHASPQSNFKGGRDHPAQKPISLLAALISRSPGQIFLDPFCGVGTSLIAAKNLKRDFIGIEINPDYCKIAEERLAQGVL